MRKTRKEELLRSFPAVPEKFMEQMKGRNAENFAVMLTYGRELFVRCFHRYSKGKIEERQRYVFADDGSARYGSDDGKKWAIRKIFREPVFCKSYYGYIFKNDYQILNREAIAESCMKYAQEDLYKGDLTMEYLHLYCRHRNLEYIMKAGYGFLITEKYGGFYVETKRIDILCEIDWKSNNLLKMLNLTRTEFKLLQGNEDCYPDYIDYRKKFPKYKPEELLEISKAFGCNHGMMQLLCEPTGLKPYRIARYLNAQEIWLTDYQDYLDQCRKLGYNLHDTAISMPHRFMEMHERLSEIIDYEKTQEQRQSFEKHMQKRQKLEFQRGNLIICQPSSMKEIIAEGRNLCHCVGGYAERHAKGKLHILFIRQRDKPDKSFYTMEVNTKGEIIQVRGEHNCDPTPEVQTFIDAYKLYLKSVFRKIEKLSA